ncbi:unnamed protein product [Adineta ricciae]|uniref:RRM domain-containing protein n=1 Tax=Adineta ricciae TaxID=249248 RepID=A0A815V532_ADIRI|nr:unnamed protein product [Adineta ricciae]CAF1530031.1 unnamed protein product [Adineta ricciae]
MYSRDSRHNHGTNYNNYGYRNEASTNRNNQRRNHVIPNEPPYTAYIGNAPETMVQGDFEHQLFVGLKVKQVRLVRDRQTDRFRGFAYVDFEDADSLRSAIALDGTCVNDQPIRIDVANRPLNMTKSQGFRHKPDMESHNASRRPQYGNNNYNRPTGESRQGRNPQDLNNVSDRDYPDSRHTQGYYEQVNTKYSSTNLYDGNEREVQSPKDETSRKLSDDVFIAPDTPISNNEDENYEEVNSTEERPDTIRQKTRNWADCPIDDSVTESSPPPSSSSMKSPSSNDDFQIVRNRTPKSRTNQQSSARGRHTGNHYRGMTSSQTFSHNHGYHNLMSPSILNQSQQSYQYPYHNNRQRMNNNQRNEKNFISNSYSTDDFSANALAAAENRPRLQLLPRSLKVSSTKNDNTTVDFSSRNANIFGSGKPRDEHDPKIVELDKHIDEVIDKVQQLSRTTSTTSNDESKNDVIKPVRILSSKSTSSSTH